MNTTGNSHFKPGPTLTRCLHVCGDVLQTGEGTSCLSAAHRNVSALLPSIFRDSYLKSFTKHRHRSARPLVPLKKYHKLSTTPPAQHQHYHHFLTCSSFSSSTPGALVACTAVTSQSLNVVGLRCIDTATLTVSLQHVGSSTRCSLGAGG